MLERSLGSIAFFGLIRARLGGRWFHPWLLGSLEGALGVIRRRLIHSQAPRGSLGSSRVVGFARARPSGR